MHAARSALNRLASLPIALTAASATYTTIIRVTQAVHVTDHIPSMSFGWYQIQTEVCV